MHDSHWGTGAQEYFFHVVTNGKHTAQSDGLEFPDKAAAWREASMSCGDLIREMDGNVEAGCNWKMEVADRFGNTIFRFTFTAEEL